jgi:hypothetical protein
MQQQILTKEKMSRYMKGKRYFEGSKITVGEKFGRLHTLEFLTSQPGQ